MIYENLIILKKLVRSDSKEEFYYEKHHKKYYFSWVSNFFHKKMFFLSWHTTDNIIFSFKIIEKHFFQSPDFYTNYLNYLFNFQITPRKHLMRLWNTHSTRTYKLTALVLITNIMEDMKNQEDIEEEEKEGLNCIHF